jgi:hypothetical protein
VEPREEIRKPKLALEYEDGMKGVNLQDKVTATFPIMRRTVKGCRKIFFYLLDICIFNSFVVFCTFSGRKERYTDFRVAVATQLLGTVQLPDYKVRGQPSPSATPLRLQANNWAHFPMHIPSTEEKKNPSKRCIVCSKKTTKEVKQHGSEKSDKLCCTSRIVSRFTTPKQLLR